MPSAILARRAMLVLIAASTILFFGQGTTFSSMGIALFAMVAEFHWSEAGAGGAFLALGLICAATSLAPMLLIPRIGGRWTMVAGALILAAGFLLAAATENLPTFYVAAGLFGLAFSLVANATGTYLVATWFGARSPRMIGIYLMVGSLGGAVGPPVTSALIATGGGWRFYWLAMAGAALVLAAMCAGFIREAPSAEVPGPAGGLSDHAPRTTEWGFRGFLRTPQFAVAALAMVATQACVIMVSSVAAPHMVQLGWSEGFAADLLGLQGLVGTAATGVAGWLTERRDPKLALAAGLLAEALGMLLLAYAHGLLISYAFVVAFGIGWGVASLAVTVLLIRYFGDIAGTAALSTIWLFAGASTASPYVAGKIDDLTGSFVPALTGLGLALLPIAFLAFAMNSARRIRTAA
jgi:MFS family permease